MIKSFTCPFCGCTMSTSSNNHRIKPSSFEHTEASLFSSPGYPHIDLYYFKCPNEDCEKITVIAQGVNGYMDDKSVPLYPEALFKYFPDYVPLPIRQDYEEACLIRFRSPKASATLARRCLQGMIRDFWAIRKNRLFDEIDELKDKVPAAQWKAIDALRRLGNIGAHMEKDVNLIIDIDPDEAGKIIELIELLIEKWYVSRHEEDALYSKIISLEKDKAEQKD